MVQAMQGNRFIHAKQVYAISPASIEQLQIHSEAMISYGSRKLGKRVSAKERWRALRGSNSASIMAPPGTSTAAEGKGPADEAMSRALDASPAALISSDEEFFFRSSEFLSSNDPNEKAFWLALGIEPPPSALGENQQD
jgi:hypothetical protein